MAESAQPFSTTDARPSVKNRSTWSVIGLSDAQSLACNSPNILSTKGGFMYTSELQPPQAPKGPRSQIRCSPTKTLYSLLRSAQPSGESPSVLSLALTIRICGIASWSV